MRFRSLNRNRVPVSASTDLIEGGAKSRWKRIHSVPLEQAGGGRGTIRQWALHGHKNA
jgi:hypothetical protein